MRSFLYSQVQYRLTSQVEIGVIFSIIDPTQVKTRSELDQK